MVKVHQKVPGLLVHPLPRRMSGDPAVLNEEQHVQVAQEHGIDMEEVHGEDRLRLSLKKCPPGLPGSSGRRVDGWRPESETEPRSWTPPVDVRIFEDLPHRRRASLYPSPASSQDEDLGVLGAVGARQQGKPAEHAERHKISESL
jgi:hypothetical protein